MVLHLRLNAPENWEGAKCEMVKVTRDVDPFFDSPEDAVEFCNGDADGVVCPLRDQCLLFALTNNCAWGVYGGMTEDDRRALRKKWPLKSGKEPRPEWVWMPPGEPRSMLTVAEQATLHDESAWSDG
jgi:hypothetical protein